MQRLFVVLDYSPKQTFLVYVFNYIAQAINSNFRKLCPNSQTFNFLHFCCFKSQINSLEMMLANKLEEMKKRLLLQSQVKKENQENCPKTPLLEEPLAQASPLVQLASQPIKSKQVEQDEDHADSPEESNSADKVSQKEAILNQQQKPQENADLNPPIQHQNPIIQEEGEINENVHEPNNEKIVELPRQQPEQPIYNQQNLDLARDQNAFMSIDEEVRQVINEKINEIQKEIAPEQSKVEIKARKIVIKELYKVKQCIKNLQSAVIGLQYIQQKVKYYPSLKGKLQNYIKQLKQANKP